jgi:mRNA-degrading endonuclease RelE of RelBE toxin-antitoxin system
MQIAFHCCQKIRKSGKKSKHRVLETCDDVQKVLKLKPDYGQSIPKFDVLRKMRIAVPGLNVGKSGGYRLIYREREIDDVIHVVFLETYFKGDKDDLSDSEYKFIKSVSEEILSDPIAYDWTDPEDLEIPEP